MSVLPVSSVNGVFRSELVDSSPESFEPPPARPDDDDRLAIAARGGDMTAFNSLVSRHERTVFSVCLRILRDPSAAEDVTQDTFVKAWTSLASFRGGYFRPWLIRIATNRCYDTLRAQNRRPAASLDAELFEVEPEWSTHVAAGEDPERFAARAELAGFLEDALGTLPDDQRVAIVLSDVQGYSYDEIATILDIALGTVKSRISRGRARLRDMLTRDPETMEHFGAYRRSLPNED